MDKMLYVAMTGAKHVQLQQATTANNLANANTNGFKAEIAAFRALPVVADAPATPTRAFVVDSTIAHDRSQGPMLATGNDQDFAVNGAGFFAVQGLDGQEAYTRDGGYVVDSQGTMRTRGGYPILSDGGPITVPPNARVEIANDGTISATPIGENPRQTQVLGQLKLVGDANRTDFYKGTDGLFRRNDKQTAQRDDTVKVSTGVLEGSNVNPVDSLVQMIAHARQHELNVKLMQTADQNARSATAIMTMAGIHTGFGDVQRANHDSAS